MAPHFSHCFSSLSFIATSTAASEPMRYPTNQIVSAPAFSLEACPVRAFLSRATDHGTAEAWLGAPGAMTIGVAEDFDARRTVWSFILG